ncbi:uncharacterized protein LOC143021168 [Oratosquilla oratoria]|uniref:uncharacterized protein LOC143021168 n=1 Tax=Oratosquilla oratoria TaxID=337810 RepID=UPI003F765F30
MEAPFLSHRGEPFRQVDGVAMGSPLGVLFANIESSDTRKLVDALKANSVLNFTIEGNKDKTLPFLDVLVEKKEDHYATSVFTKDTNVGRCLNARGDCPDAYKRSVVGAYVRRAFSHCSTWKAVHTEFELTVTTGQKPAWELCLDYRERKSHIGKLVPVTLPVLVE